LQALAGWAEELWLTLPDEADTDRAEVFTRSRATLARLEPLQPAVETLARVPDQSARQDGQAPQAAQGLPAGLAHVERELFRPLKAVRRSTDAAGILCIE